MGFSCFFFFLTDIFRFSSTDGADMMIEPKVTTIVLFLIIQHRQHSCEAVHCLFQQ